MSSTKGLKIAEMFKQAIAKTKCFDQNLRQDIIYFLAKLYYKPFSLESTYYIVYSLVQPFSREKVKVICCGHGRMVTEFQVGPEHLNQRGTLHGGFIAHLVDAISTYALTTNDTIDTRGVSIDLSVTYMTAAREGDWVQVEAVTKKTGKKIAFLEVEVRNKDNNVLLATGKHTKYIGI